MGKQEAMEWLLGNLEQWPSTPNEVAAASPPGWHWVYSVVQKSLYLSDNQSGCIFEIDWLEARLEVAAREVVR
ncbi:hypothetical protein [Dongshaea marina]|uniref:hypothetical protein n=1 Tax=Dongshaea marina TaxID=2047966 RepID=UPI000D3E87B3|nr:hypothetical protein [Dongshaea marina]